MNKYISLDMLVSDRVTNPLGRGRTLYYKFKYLHILWFIYNLSNVNINLQINLNSNTCNICNNLRVVIIPLRNKNKE